MKKLLFTLVALLSMTTVMAQNQNGAPQPPKKKTHQEITTEMNTQLKLSADQKTKVAALNKEYQDVLNGPGPGGPGGPGMGKGNPPKMDGKASSSNGRPEPPQMTEAQKKQMKQHQAKRQEYEKKLQGILSADQFKSYQKMRPQQKGPKPPKEKK